MSINIITGLQDDALSSQYQIIFPLGIPGGGDAQLLSLRMDQPLDIPNRTAAQYEVVFQGIKIPKTSYNEETTKQITLSFRQDTNWLVYRALDNWFRLVLNEETGTGSVEKDTRVPMVAQFFGPNKEVKAQIRFNDIKIFDIKLTTFDHTSPDPVRVEAQFIYSFQEFL